MKIETFVDEGLAHNSYAVLSKNQIAVVDPSRDIQPYINFASANNAKIVAIIETHPHADFVSGHLELKKKTGAPIYVSSLLGAKYDFSAFEEGAKINIGELVLSSINTPGHSPDSISIIVSENGTDKAVLTGDTLFVGDVGRPDLREGVGNIQATKEDLAASMYDSTRNKLMKLQDEVLVLPAHGAGSLCGKNISSDLYSTIGKELKSNYALQEMSKEKFVSIITADNPLIPKYFPFDVELNRSGAPDLEESIAKIPVLTEAKLIENDKVVIDARDHYVFKKKHIRGAFNLQDGDKFETWLGTIVAPESRIVIVTDSIELANTLIRKASKIGYESLVDYAILASDELFQQNPTESIALLDYQNFLKEQDNFFILDIRNKGEVANGKFFDSSLNIPLADLEDEIAKLKNADNIVVHCAAGYRSAAGVSILKKHLPSGVKIYDLSFDVEKHKN